MSSEVMASTMPDRIALDGLGGHQRLTQAGDDDFLELSIGRRGVGGRWDRRHALRSNTWQSAPPVASSAWRRLTTAPFLTRAHAWTSSMCTPLPHAPGTMLILVPTSGVDLCERFLKPVAGPILPPLICKMQEGLTCLTQWALRSHMRRMLPLTAAACCTAAFLKPVARKRAETRGRWETERGYESQNLSSPEGLSDHRRGDVTDAAVRSTSRTRVFGIACDRGAGRLPGGIRCHRYFRSRTVHPRVLRSSEVLDGSLKLGWAVSCLGWGAMAGNLAAGLLSDRFGRKTVLLLTAVLFLASSLTAAFSTQLCDVRRSAHLRWSWSRRGDSHRAGVYRGDRAGRAAAAAWSPSIS